MSRGFPHVPLGESAPATSHMSYRYAEATDEVTLADGETLSGTAGYLNLAADDADFVRVYVDDGSGGDPASHDLTIESHKDALNDYIQVASQAGTTARLLTVTAPGDDLRIDLKDQTGDATNDTYRIYAEALRVNSTPENGRVFD